MMAQAILTFSPHNGWSVSLSYRDKKVVHWVMQVVGAILATTGSIIRITNLTNNFQTPHGILGISFSFIRIKYFCVESLLRGVRNVKKCKWCVWCNRAKLLFGKCLLRIPSVGTSISSAPNLKPRKLESVIKLCFVMQQETRTVFF